MMNDYKMDLKMKQILKKEFVFKKKKKKILQKED